MSSPTHGPVDPRDRRIGDVERTAALDALGKHLSAGRIDVAEFTERSGAVARARTGRELAALFDDLPAPHPSLPAGPALAAPRDLPPVTPVRSAVPQRTSAESRDSLAVGIVAVSALLLFLLVGRFVPMAWLIFLTVPLAALVLRARRSGR